MIPALSASDNVEKDDNGHHSSATETSGGSPASRDLEPTQPPQVPAHPSRPYLDTGPTSLTRGLHRTADLVRALHPGWV